TGAGRTVCIIDTGYQQSHEDLPDAAGGYSQVDASWSTDGYGHGTHVGGTIAAQNNGLGVVGVTPGTVGLYIIKIFNDSGRWTTSSDLVDALNRCVAAGSNVVSMSLGGGSYVSNENAAFAAAYAGGVLSVAAAGNDGNTSYSYPASYASVVSVAAVSSSKTLASFSQRNDQVELAAPGVSVLSTYPPNGYAYMSGTSMATPHVSAVAALIWSANPSWSAAQIRGAMQATAEDLGAAGRDTSFGYGLVRAKLALDYLGGGTPPVNNAPSVSISSPANNASFDSGTSISFAGSATDAQDGNLSASLVWTSSRDGQIGTGGAFSAVLSDGTHTITASVTDSGSLTGSAAITLVVQPASTGTITVSGLAGSSATINKNFWRATVTASVDPDVAGAVVTGSWSSGGSGSCTTDGSRQCAMATNVRTKSYASTTFTVTDVALSGYTYDASITSVTVSKP
ncbi:MAG: S8 family peptidase, partial [Chloroflexi bacterium]|nr:S8 family peptidase [Chloroflexota bacterium]